MAGGYDSLGNPLVDMRRREVKDKIEAFANMVERAVLDGTLETAQFNIIETNVFVKYLS